ncbi:SdiA-regulated domain-containing protein [Flavisolibacter nicotianae]|uniref:SdiA-regulated domain-containing protein n=1 Tax=Flavisolibacter nicotianae TaxID=2364882 RepID=UPI000EB3348D|nr:SdiA-regulated domain-containing protein [Flavisolibacter nicotianae]
MMKMLFQKECLPSGFLVFVCALLFGMGCKQKQTISPEGYRIDKPQIVPLGKVLNEISGICFNKENGDLLAISDSKEQVFELDLRNIKLKDYTSKVVPKDSDLEDLVKVNANLYLLMSRGEIVELPEKATDTAGMKTYALNLGGVNDFETLYYDPSINSLVMLCKTCAHEKGSGTRTAYRFDLKTKTFDSTEFYTISKDDVKAVLKTDNAKFDPSAAAIHPLNKRLYILSSAGNLLVVTDTRGKVAEAYELNPDLFPQAEGIAFAPNGTMFISNEKKFGKPTLLVFPYQTETEKKK